MSYKPSPELTALIDDLLGEERDQFFLSIDNPLPHTIRFNSLKGSPELLKSFLEEQGFSIQTFPGFDDIYRLPRQPFPIGKSLSHFLGHIYVQDIASMLPARVLAPQPGDRVLDISAAPGSKTTQMAVMMKNQGLILANDIIPKRLRVLINNVQRLGIVNTAIIRSYGESLGNLYHETFDKVLVDPACSGLGTLHKSPEILSWWTPKHCTRMASSQKGVLLSAVKALKPGGSLVYSTCTISPQENEEVIDQVLQEMPVELRTITLPGLITRHGLTEFRKQKYHPDLKKCLRIYPFENQTEGFFLAKLVKTSTLEPRSRLTKKPVKIDYLGDKTSPIKKYLDYFSQHFQIPRSLFSQLAYYLKSDISAVTPEIANFSYYTKPFKTGLTIARPMTHIAKLTTEGTHLFGKSISENIFGLNSLQQLEAFVNRESLQIESLGKLQTVVTYRDMIIGYGLFDNGKFRSQFPKAEWPFTLIAS